VTVMPRQLAIHETIGLFCCELQYQASASSSLFNCELRARNDDDDPNAGSLAVAG